MMEYELKGLFEDLAPKVIKDFFRFMNIHGFAVVEIQMSSDDKDKVADLRMFPHDGERVKWIIERYLDWNNKR